MNSEQAIRERSYLIWEREGRPHGRGAEHWLQAETELSAGQDAAPKPRAPAASAKRAAAGAAKSAPAVASKRTAKKA
jgi:hypothetical protein